MSWCGSYRSKDEILEVVLMWVSFKRNQRDREFRVYMQLSPLKAEIVKCCGFKRHGVVCFSDGQLLNVWR